jgi:RNA polymerase sigma-70 factor, ECF subfamily
MMNVHFPPPGLQPSLPSLNVIDATRTTTQLLEGLRHPENDTCWREFDERYRPILVNLAMRQGVSEADAPDVAQDVLAGFAKAYAAGRYDREKGRLRMWLMGMARRSIADWKRKARSRGVALDGAGAEPADDGMEAMWEAEQRQFVLRTAFERLREESRLSPESLRLFQMHVIEGRGVEQVVAELGVTAHDVYQAKSRCLTKLREICDEIEKAFEGE